MKTIDDLFTEYESLLEDDPFNRIGKLRHDIVRQLRWDAIIIKFRIRFSKANLEINERQGFIKFDTKKYGRLAYYPKADRLLIMAKNKWLYNAQNWLNDKAPDFIPKQEFFDVVSEYESWLEDRKITF